MKKILSSLILVSLLAVPVIVGSAAAASVPIAPELDICCGADSVVVRIINWLFVILLIVAALFIIIAAYTFVTAMGDPDKVGKARSFVLYALIGVLVGFAAKGLIKLIEMIVTPKA